MRFKMNADQHEALYNLYRTEVVTEKPMDDGAELILDFMADIYEKLRKKQKAKLVGDWSLTLTPKETLAYKIYWIEKQLKKTMIYESLLINSHITIIDQLNTKLTPLEQHNGERNQRASLPTANKRI